MAAINLGKVGKTAGLIPLLEVVQSKEFHKKEAAEVKSFFDAIGMVGSNEATPVLQQVLERKSWFGRGTMDEMRSGAAAAMVGVRYLEEDITRRVERYFPNGTQTLNADAQLDTMSVIKIPLMVEVFEQVKAGRFALSDKYTLKPEDVLPGTGIMRSLDAGAVVTVKDLVTLMIVVSDNTATDVLYRMVGSLQWKPEEIFQ